MRDREPLPTSLCVLVPAIAIDDRAIHLCKCWIGDLLALGRAHKHEATVFAVLYPFRAGEPHNIALNKTSKLFWSSDHPKVRWALGS